MGTKLKDLVVRTPTSVKELTGKTLAVDTYNILFQFLATIRAPDGSLFTDTKGNVTSHLIGLFNRTTTLMMNGIKLVFILDGEPPLLKHEEIMARKEAKAKAQEKYKEAAEKKDLDQMKKYAARTSVLTTHMITDAKAILNALGLPIIQAPSEGEAQAAHIVKKGDAWAVASQDYNRLQRRRERNRTKESTESR